MKHRQTKIDREAIKYVSSHYDDELLIAAMLHPIFNTEAYKRSYRLHDEFMAEVGLNVIERSYIHCQVRKDILQKLKDNPHRYER